MRQMKRIYIEASSFYGKRSGVGRYGLMVSQHLERQRPDDQFVLFSFLRPGRQLVRDFTPSTNTCIKYIRWFPGRAFSLLMRKGMALPLELFGMWRADILLFPNFIAWASILRKPRISIVHDVAFLFYPEYIQTKNLEYLKRQLARSLERSTKVIAVSEATKSDLIKQYSVPAQKIHVVYNAVDTALFNPDAHKRTAEVCKQRGIPTKYLLFVGNVEPRKNLEGLLQAYAQSYPQHKLALVIVGAKGWNDSGIERRIHHLKGLPIHRTEFIDDNDLAALYAGAEAFIYPSYYEGFGIPCLEAMASGCPVICSDTSSLPEVVGEAGVLVAPTDTAGLSAAITHVTSDDRLRKRLIAAGLKQAQKFTWEASARQLSKVIDSL